MTYSLYGLCRFGLAGALALGYADFGAADGPPVSSVRPIEGPTALRTPTLYGDDLIDAAAGRPRMERYLGYNGDLGKYWTASQAAREGKTLEALFAQQENARFRALRDGRRVILTSVEGMPGASFDAYVVDAQGRILCRIQIKMGWANVQTALLDPKYSGMHILTDADTLAILQKELGAEQAKALRRGLPLGERWRAVDEALKSGRLMQRTPSGAPLIPRKTVTDAAYGSLQRAWGRLSSAAKSGGAGLPKLAAQRAPAKAVKPVAVVADAKEASRITSFLKSPGFMAGAATFAVDGGMAVYRYWDGQANESELGEALQDAGVKAAAVGGAVQVLYVLAATPHGAVVAGVAIVTYAVTDAVISHFRDCAKRSVRIADLEGIAPASFLKNLPPALGEVPKEGAGSALP